MNIRVYSLYPIFLSKSFRHLISASFSTPLGLEPSITPNMPFPSFDSATITSTSFAVAQNIEHTSLKFLMAFKTLMG